MNGVVETRTYVDGAEFVSSSAFPAARIEAINLSGDGRTAFDSNMIKKTSYILFPILLVLTSCRVSEIKSSYPELYSLHQEIVQSRNLALIEAMERYQKLSEFKVLKRNQSSVLIDIIQESIRIDLPVVTWDNFHIIDFYELAYGDYGVLIWKDTVFYEFAYDTTAKKISRSRVFNGFSEYPRNPNIHLSLVEFYSDFDEDKGLEELPGNGRSNNPNYVYSRVTKTDEGGWRAISFALIQW